MKVLLALVAASVTTGAHSAVLPVQPFYLGINGPAQGGYGPTLATLGFNAVRFDLPWKVAEPVKGQWAIPQAWNDAVNQYNGAGVQPILILDYGNLEWGIDRPSTPAQFEEWYTRYAKRIISHFVPRVRYFEIWNEWNGKIGTNETTNGSPETYVSFAQHVISRARQDFPSADMVFIVGSPSAGGMQDPPPNGRSWLRNAVNAGLQSTLLAADGIGLHPYAERGIAGDATRNHAEDSVTLVKNVNTYIQQAPNGTARPLFITEIGWTTSLNPVGVDESTQAIELARSLLHLRAISNVKGVWAFKYQDGNADLFSDQRGYGIRRFGTNAPNKPAAQAISDIADTLKNSTQPLVSSIGGPLGKTFGGTFSMPEQFTHYAVWSTGPKSVGEAYETYNANLNCSEPMTLKLTEVGTGTSTDYPCAPGSGVLVRLDKRPILIKPPQHKTITISVTNP